MPDGRGSESFEEWLARKAAKKDQPKPVPGLRRSGLKRGKPLKPISEKGKKRAKEYKKAREEHYSDEDNRRCALCGSTNNLSVHHTAKRGDNTAKGETFLTLCLTGSYMARLHPQLNYAEGCHNFVEANKGWARENGYLV